MKSLAHHEAAVFGERAEVVPLMHGYKSAKGVKTLAGFQRALMGRADGDASVACVRHGHGKRYQARAQLYVADSQADVNEARRRTSESEAREQAVVNEARRQASDQAARSQAAANESRRRADEDGRPRT